MDAPNVDVKFLQPIQQDREETKQHGLIDIEWCGLHTIHKLFNTGAEKTD